MTKSEFLQKTLPAFTALASNLDVELKKEVMDLWVNKLINYPLPVVLQAFDNVINSYEGIKFPPYAVMHKEVNKLMGTAIKAEEVNLDTLAEAEWSWLEDAIARFGSWNPPRIPHETTEYVLNSMGGWGSLCAELTNDSRKWLRKEFVEIWKRSHKRVSAMQGGAKAVEAAQQGALGQGGNAPQTLGMGTPKRALE